MKFAGAALCIAFGLSVSPALADLPDPDPSRRSNPSVTLTSTSLDAATSFWEDPAVVFSAIDGPYAAFTAASGSLGFDDYVTTVFGQSDVMLLSSFRFVGGVTEIGDIIFFDFYDSLETYVDGFGVQFTQAGNFIWTITINDEFIAPTGGVVQLTAPTNQGTNGSSAGQWFLSTTIPTIGIESRGYGSTSTHSHRFETTAAIPEPASVSILLLAAMGLIRRRRAV